MGIGVLLLALPWRGGANIGASLALWMLIAITFHLPLASVVEERSSKTLPFLMSLPISPPDYVASKIVANMGLFLLPWLTVVFGITVFARDIDDLSSGFVPVALVGMLLGFSLVLGFSLITESAGWTEALIVALLFLSANVLPLLILNNETVQRAMQSIARGGSALDLTLLAELLMIGLILTATFLVQSRKKDFL